jgi:hypothetical protein
LYVGVGFISSYLVRIGVSTLTRLQDLVKWVS